MPACNRDKTPSRPADRVPVRIIHDARPIKRQRALPPLFEIFNDRSRARLRGLDKQPRSAPPQQTERVRVRLAASFPAARFPRFAVLVPEIEHLLAQHAELATNPVRPRRHVERERVSGLGGDEPVLVYGTWGNLASERLCSAGNDAIKTRLTAVPRLTSCRESGSSGSTLPKSMDACDIRLFLVEYRLDRKA